MAFKAGKTLWTVQASTSKNIFRGFEASFPSSATSHSQNRFYVIHGLELFRHMTGSHGISTPSKHCVFCDFSIIKCFLLSLSSISTQRRTVILCYLPFHIRNFRCLFSLSSTITSDITVRFHPHYNRYINIRHWIFVKYVWYINFNQISHCSGICFFRFSVNRSVNLLWQSLNFFSQRVQGSKFFYSNANPKSDGFFFLFLLGPDIGRFWNLAAVNQWNKAPSTVG